jgi:hypothetical protein
MEILSIKSEKRQSVTMIPVLLEIVKDMQKGSEKEKNHLEEWQKGKLFLKKDNISQIVKFYWDQNALIPYYLEQCHFWKNHTHTLNNRQKQWIYEIESTLDWLKKNNASILSLTNKKEKETAKATEKEKETEKNRENSVDKFIKKIINHFLWVGFLISTIT